VVFPFFVSFHVLSLLSPLCVAPVPVAFPSVIVAGLPLLLLLLAGQFVFEAKYSGSAFGRKVVVRRTVMMKCFDVFKCRVVLPSGFGLIESKPLNQP